ncbi:MAG TPA: cytochrome c peroxidase [Polyangia bacterium]
MLTIVIGPACEQPAPGPSPIASSRAAPAIDEPLQPLPLRVELDARKAVLGEQLFHDPILSRDGKLSCAGCHPLDRGGMDRQKHSGGVDGPTAVNTPTIFNVGFSFRFNWNGAYETLEEELDAPLQRAMGTSGAEVLQKLRGQPGYREAFARAYPEGLTDRTWRDALATYERSLYTPNARFDRWLRGEANVLSADEKEGYFLFKSYGCASCHQGENVGGNMFQKLGVMADYFADRGNESGADQGRYGKTRAEKDRHVFRVPSLRNVALTAPYFHDGSAATLVDAIRVMARYQLGRPLEDAHVERIAAFLRTLTGEYRGRPL